MDDPPQDVARTLSLLRDGDPDAASELMEIVYEPLRALASNYFRSQPADHTLQPTALVHEVFLKVVDRNDSAWNDRAHFLAVCATAMRGILVDHARAKASTKRGGEFRRVPIEGVDSADDEDHLDVLDLEEHLAQLTTLHERQARIVVCRFYSGMTIPEVAEVLGVSQRTVNDDWAMARAWLNIRLTADS